MINYFLLLATLLLLDGVAEGPPSSTGTHIFFAGKVRYINAPLFISAFGKKEDGYSYIMLHTIDPSASKKQDIIGITISRYKHARPYESLFKSKFLKYEVCRYESPDLTAGIYELKNEMYNGTVAFFGVEEWRIQAVGLGAVQVVAESLVPEGMSLAATGDKENQPCKVLKELIGLWDTVRG